MPTLEVDSLLAIHSRNPRAAMRTFMCDAEMGDEQKGEDQPSTAYRRWSRHCSARRRRSSCLPGRCATRSPSKVHTAPRRGVDGPHAHPIHQAGAPGLLSGVIIHRIGRARTASTRPSRWRRRFTAGPPTPRQRASSGSRTRATSAAALSWPLERIEAVGATAQVHGLRRIWTVARPDERGRRPYFSRRLRRLLRSVWIDFTRGWARLLGRRSPGRTLSSRRHGDNKQAFGGALRQAGSSRRAASTPPRTQRSSGSRRTTRHARILAEGLAEIPASGIDPRTVETNLVFFDVSALGLTAVQWCEAVLCTACA